jgi:hypothetical protein
MGRVFVGEREAAQRAREMLRVRGKACCYFGEAIFAKRAAALRGDASAKQSRVVLFPADRALAPLRHPRRGRRGGQGEEGEDGGGARSGGGRAFYVHHEGVVVREVNA